MSQHDFDIATADANTGVTVRAAINAALQALASCSSGTTAPTTPYPCQFWADTTTGKLWQRNAANNAWIDKGLLVDPVISSSAPVVTGDLQINATGKGLQVKGGTDARCGQYVVASSTNNHVIPNTTITDKTRIFVTKASGNISIYIFRVTRINGTSFTIVTSGAETIGAKFDWFMVEEM